MKVYKYLDDKDYCEAQERANIRKLNKVWVRKSTIDAIKNRIASATHILCHGTRNAAEQHYFKLAYPDATIIGTEISSTATNFPMTVRWDFRKQNQEWINKFDVVYSNSIDHTNEPQQTINVWRDQIRSNGHLIVEFAYDALNNRARCSDPLQATTQELEELFAAAKLKIVDFFDETHEKGVCRIYFLHRIND